MSSVWNNMCLFIAGVAAGSAVSWAAAKRRYGQIAQEEIDSVKAAFSKEKADKGKDRTDTHNDDNKDTYEERLEKYGYTKKKDADSQDKRKEEGMDRPYVIKPEEFGEFEDYERISLTYYADQILVDDGGELVEDVDNIVGFESLGRFGEYEEDSVFVRNDRMKCDYEILSDHRNYFDVMEAMPHHMEAGW
ncbi:hypothetical protein AALC25_00255 [Lachnospiraceae bacterium 29-84]